MASAGVTTADQRPRGLHARQRVHPGRDRGARLLGRRRLLAPTASPAPAGWAARSRIGSWTASRSYDLWKMDIRRFGAQYRSRAVVQARATENYATYYDIHYPNEERQSARPLRLSPTYGRLAELGCAFGEKSGWERPNWFEQQRRRPATRRSARAAGPATTGRRPSRPRRWPPAPRQPCSTRRASRRSRSAGRARSPSSSACAPTTWIDPIGRITYTQMLNRRGGIECDFTVTRLGEDRFFIVTGTAFGNHDLGWIRSARPRRRQRDRDRRDLVAGVPRDLGSARARRSWPSTSTDDWSTTRSRT